MRNSMKAIYDIKLIVTWIFKLKKAYVLYDMILLMYCKGSYEGDSLGL